MGLCTIRPIYTGNEIKHRLQQSLFDRYGTRYLHPKPLPDRLAFGDPSGVLGQLNIVWVRKYFSGYCAVGVIPRSVFLLNVQRLEHHNALSGGPKLQLRLIPAAVSASPGLFIRRVLNSVCVCGLKWYVRTLRRSYPSTGIRFGNLVPTAVLPEIYRILDLFVAEYRCTLAILS